MMRNLPADGLVAALSKMKMSNFRAVTDNDMIHESMTRQFQNGEFGRRFAERGYRLLVGETETEVRRGSS
jgi:hypothetical protein